jgi:cation diffusion facilitator CzcD-associated flavoprotein CzcO
MGGGVAKGRRLSGSEPSAGKRSGREPSGHEVKVAIVGAGFSGLGMAIGLKRHHINNFVVLERADDLGGTWRENSYPGCACDVPSHLYSFSFAPNPDWSHIFARREEIWAYLRDRFAGKTAPSTCATGPSTTLSALASTQTPVTTLTTVSGLTGFL